MFGSLRIFHWLLIFVQYYFIDIQGNWPPSNSSNIQLLGLFPDEENASQTTELSIHSRAMFKSAVRLSQQYNLTIDGRQIDWQSVQTGGHVIRGLSETCRLISSSNIIGIIGPAYSRESHQIADFAQTIGLPVISYASTDPDLSDRYTYPSFSRTVPSDTLAALALVKFFLRYNWTSCVIIHQNDAFGSNGARIISETFFNYNLIVQDLIVFDIVSQTIRGDLKKSLMNSLTRIVLLWTSVSSTPSIIQTALDLDVLGPQFTWILSSTIPLTSFDQQFEQNLIGMISIQPVPGKAVDAPINETLLNAAYQLWQEYEPESYPGSTKVNSYALFAFDATWTLIQSLQQFCSINMKNSSSSCLAFEGSSFCFNRHLINSDLLLNQINSMEFLGISGPIKFNLNVTDRMNGSYYYIQNVQYSSNDLTFVPVLKYSYPNDDWQIYSKSNQLIWPGNVVIPPTDRAILRGVTLRIGVIESPPFTFLTNVIDTSRKNISKLVGYIPDLIDLLTSQMGFLPDIQLAPSNQSYSAFVQSVANGLYDIVIGDVTVTSQRRELVAFSNSIFDNSLRILMRKTPEIEIDLFAYLKPFSRELWLLLFGATLLASLLLCLFEKQHNEALQTRSMMSSSGMSFWFSIGTILGYGADFHARTAAGRILTVGLYMLSLVLVASYTANLASDLTISKSKSIISSIDDLKNGKMPFNRIGIRVGTAGEEYYLRVISGGNRNFYPLKSRQDLYDSLLSGRIDASLMDIGVAEYVTNNIYCNLTLIGGDFDQSVFAIVTPKQWLYGKDFDVKILALREDGSLDNLRQKWFQTKICPETIETSTAMTIQSLSGLFLTFAIIVLLAFVLFLGRKLGCFRKCRSRLRYRRKLWFKKQIYMVNHQENISNRTQQSSFPSPVVLRIGP